MSASANDKFMKAGAGTVTTLSAPGKALSATSITVGSTTNYPTDTGIVFAIRQVDVNGELVTGTYTEWAGTVTSGTTLSMDAAPVYGSDQVYPAGSTTQVYIPLSSSAHNKMVDGLLVSHDQDGTLKAGAVDNAAVLASNVVETAKIKDGAVTAGKMSLGASSAYTDTYETTTSSSYTSLTTSTSVTLNVNTAVLIIIAASASNSVSAGFSFISFEASGANTIAASDSNSAEAIMNPVPSNGYRLGISFSRVLTGLTPGSTTFSMRFRAAGGTAGFSRRSISVVPIG